MTEELAEKTEMCCGAEIPAYDSVAYDQVKTSLSKSLPAQLSLGARIGVFDLTRETREETGLT